MTYREYDDDAQDDAELRGLYLSRIMFGWMLPEPIIERRSWDEFMAAHSADYEACTALGGAPPRT